MKYSTFLAVMALGLCADRALAITTTLEYENSREAASRAAISNDIAAAIAALPPAQTDLTPATNYTDSATNALMEIIDRIPRITPSEYDSSRAAVADVAIKLAPVAGSHPYTSADIFDAIGGKASTNDAQLTPAAFTKWTIVPSGHDGHPYHVVYDAEFNFWSLYDDGAIGWISDASSTSDSTALHFDASYFGLPDVVATRKVIGYTLGAQTDKVLASTNLESGVSAAVVTNIVRDLSLGGIWDSTLQVWWTPRMVNGSLTYHATTNVNLSAEN